MNEAKRAQFHLPGLFEFYDFYCVFLPLYRTHREYFYDWCEIASIYGAPEGCLWGGGRVGCGNQDPHAVLALTQEYGLSARLTFSNSLLRPEHLSDPRCNRLCRLLAESPGPQVDKLVPKVQSTAKILYGIYFALTVLELVFLLVGRMPLFEAMLTAFGTAGTGGFGFRNDSFASFSPYIQWVVTIFMILFGVNFNAYFLLLMRKFRRAAASEEVRGYFVVIVVAVGIITANIYSMYNSFGEALRQAAFQVGSIITTTGFSSCDFDLWPTLSKEILVMLMFIGACAGSTGGGIKVSRFLILGKTLAKELKTALHPQVVAPARMDGKLLNHETIRTTNVFIAAYIFIFAASFFLISLNGFDMVTNFTAVAATLNNIGPGLEMAGPMQNFGCFADPAKLVLIFDMLAGRLEIFPMLVLFMPDTWRRF